jgi:aspartokinase/homoserine dehydrogenase 1
MAQKILNVVLCGTGTVGGALLQQMAAQQQLLLSERNLNLRIVGVVDIFNIMTDKQGLDLSSFSMEQFREEFAKSPKSSLQLIHDSVLQLRKEVEGDMVFVDCTASYDIATLYQDFLDAKVSVACANKVAASGDINAYRRLKQTAVRNDVKYNFETNVGAGLPVIHTIDDLVKSGDRITKIEAVLSGTLNFIFNTISRDVTFSEAVKKAKEERFSEPDPRIDLSGIDVIRKLVILARESGYEVSQDDVEKHLFVPQEYFEGTLDDFWHNLPKLDPYFEALRREVADANQCLRFIAKLEVNGNGNPLLRACSPEHLLERKNVNGNPLNRSEGALEPIEPARTSERLNPVKCSVSLEKVGLDTPFAKLEGSNNIVILHTERYTPHPLMIQGYGAGAGVTAAGVFADILDIVNV